jgi:Mannitol repressor
MADDPVNPIVKMVQDALREPVSDMERQLDGLRTQIEELATRTHPGAAMVAAGIVEDWLTAILESKMRPLSNRFKAQIFKGYGPLSSFSAKLHICYALSFIDEPTYKDIQVIKDIRNEFAHTLKPLNFESDEIKRLCQKLRSYDSSATDHFDVYSRAISDVIAKLEPIHAGVNYARALLDFVEPEKPDSDPTKP